MRESEPPPGDPSLRGSRVWAYVIIAAILIFIVWFAAENWRSREPGRSSDVPAIPGSGR